METSLESPILHRKKPPRSTFLDGKSPLTLKPKADRDGLTIADYGRTDGLTIADYERAKFGSKGQFQDGEYGHCLAEKNGANGKMHCSAVQCSAIAVPLHALRHRSPDCGRMDERTDQPTRHDKIRFITLHDK